MISKCINRRLLPMKLHYFLYLGSVSSIVGFTPTIAKQLGYSPGIVGTIYTYLSIVAFVVKPISGVIVDKFPVKRFTFLMFILSCGLTAFALNFISKLPTQALVNLSCDTTTVLKICSNNDDQLSQCDDNNLSKLLNNNIEPVKCQLSCQKNESFRDEMCKSWNINDYCLSQNNDLDYLNVTLSISITDQVEKNYVFQVKSAQIKGTQVLEPTCQRPVSTECEIDCSNEIISAAVSKFRGSVFDSHQFWEFIIILTLFMISQAITWSLQDPICLDLLGDKPQDFGKQRCWGSISWGLFSIFGGLLVDYFSDGDLHKNYTPIYYLCLVVIICDFTLSYKINITETVGSKNTFSNIFVLLTKLNVIVYFMWIIVMGVCTAMLWNYLFWYMEDITRTHQSGLEPWIKTLQGTATGIQCLAEMPIYFLSGWIIKHIGYGHCVSLGLFTFAARFYLYSIITNPIWFLPIELSNGITFGLLNAVLVSYAKVIAPDDSVTTVVTFAGALFEGVGVSLGGLLGGILYDKYGGARTFQLFSYGSLLSCILHVIFTKLNKSNHQDSPDVNPSL